jgi:hypothetical protein
MRPVAGTILSLVLLASTATACAHSGEKRATLTIRLDQTTTRAGLPINGVAVVDNRGPAFAFPGGQCGWLEVGLENQQLTFRAKFSHVGCGSVQVPEGVSRYPISVSTTMSQCSPPGAPGASMATACSIGHMPPLPPGRYTTVVITGGPGYPREQPPITLANSVTVTLTAA